MRCSRLKKEAFLRRVFPSNKVVFPWKPIYSELAFSTDLTYAHIMLLPVYLRIFEQFLPFPFIRAQKLGSKEKG